MAIRVSPEPRGFGFTEFTTANVKDFEVFAFEKVWNPLHLE